MKVKDLVKWLDENTGPEDDIALLDLSDPSKEPEICPYLDEYNLVYEEEDKTLVITYFGPDPQEDE